MKISSILRLPYWQLRHPWSDHVKQFEYLDWETQRRLAYNQIDKGGFGYWTVFVAGAGFLTDAYDIFAVNTVLPMLKIVYWDGNMPANEEVLINLSLLVGTVFGQLLVGILADRYGRKRMYGIELMVLTFATVLVALTSKGALSSTNRLSWIIVWRFVMGMGIGGDYPLSAVITAEFAPRKHRGKMLSMVFFTQCIGALLANIVAIIVVTSFHKSLPYNANAVSCAGQCVEAVDNMWRWIVGLGAIPPAFAIFIRWWIPESPRYTLEVEKNPDRAKKDMNAYYHPGPDLLHMTSAVMPGLDSTTPGHSSSRSINSPATITFGEQFPATLSFGEPDEANELAFADSAGRVPSIPSIGRKMVRKETWKEFRTGFWRYMITDGNWTDLAGTSLSWMTLDFAYYFLSVNNPKILSKLWNVYDPDESVYINLLENNYRALIAVSIGAVIGGILFVVMSRYRWSLQVWSFCVLAGLFVVVGVCFVVLLDTRYFAAVIVLYSICSLFFNFGPNTSTFVISAEVFPTRYRCTCHGISAASGKLGSIIAQVFLAYAKFGSPGVSVNDPRSTWLGWVLLVFTVWMAFGAGITKVWVPNPVDIWGRSRRLEDLGRGKAARKRMELDERTAWQEFIPGTPV